MADKHSLIKNLCQRLEFPCDTEQLESPRGLQSLLQQIQWRLSQLQEEDTYEGVDDIPTDSCPVLYTEPPRTSPKTAGRRPRNLGRVLNSIMESVISSQLLQVLVADLLTSLRRSPSQSSSATNSTTRNSGNRQRRRASVEERLKPLMTEMRSETLLSEVLLSVVRAALETAAAAAAVANTYEVDEEEEEEAENQPRPADDGKKDDNPEVLAHYTPNDQLASCRSTSKPSLTFARASKTSHEQVLSSSSNAIQRRASAYGSVSGSSGRRDTFSSRASESLRSEFSGFPCYPSSAGTATQPPRTSWSARRKDSGSRSTRDSLSSAASISGGYGVARVAENAGGMGAALTLTTRQMATWKRKPVDPDEPADQEVWWTQRGEEQVESFSNIEARWRGRTIDERRRDFFWAVDDIYQHPYEGVEAVARDDWLFTGDRPGHCPMYARLNRARRAVMITRRRRDADGLSGQADRWASSPLELYNGVAHPLNPAAAPCRTAFVGE